MEEKKTSDSESPAIDEYFDSLIEDFGGEVAVSSTSQSETASAPQAMRDFSKFFNDAAAFGGGFQSTIDKTPSEISEQTDTETLSFVADDNKEIITTPVTDDDGMIVIFDEEAGIDATSSSDALTQSDSADDSSSEELTDSDDTSNSEAPEEEARSDDESKFSSDSNMEESAPEDDNDNTVEVPEKKPCFLSGILPWKGDSVGEVIRKIVFIASTAVFIGAGIMLVSTLMQSEEAKEDLQEIKESVTTTVATTINEVGEVITIPPTTEERIVHNESLMDSFVEISSDVKGFIELPGCDIYYPVVQAADNDYYLRRTYDGKSNKAGAIFMDYRCTLSAEYTSPNIVLYGHNQEDGTMFGNLKFYKNNCDFYKYNPSIVFNTEYGLGDYVIFGYFITNVYEHQDTDGEVFHYHDYIETLGNEATFNWYMNEVYERNQIISPVDVKFGDKLLVLSTCSNEYSDSRFVVMARKLREGESIYDFDFKSARLNPDAKQIDWSAIFSDSEDSEKKPSQEIIDKIMTLPHKDAIDIIASHYDENDTTASANKETETETTRKKKTTVSETEETTTSETTNTDSTAAPEHENGTTASNHSETETAVSESEESITS